MADTIPKNWTKQSLSKIGELITGNTPPKKNKEYYSSEDIDFIKPSDLQNEIIHTYSEKLSEKAREVARIAPKNTVLVTCIGNLGRMGIVSNEVAFNQQINGIIPNQDILSKFLFYRLMTEKKQMDTLSSATTVTILNKSNFGKIEITYPNSKEEQELIVAEIEKQFTRLDSAIESLQTIKKKLEVYRKSVLNFIFKNIESRPLQSFCDNFKQDIVDGPFGSNMKRSDYVSEGIPVLKIQNIKPFKIVEKKMDFVSELKYKELERHSFKPGDLIVTKLGDPLGVTAIVPDKLQKGIIVADLVRVRVNTSINKKYLCYVLNSPITINYINSKQKGTTRPRVKLSIVRELSIPFVDLEEQERIVQEIESHFSIIDKLEETINASLLKAETLRKSILKSAFEGKLVRYDDD